MPKIEAPKTTELEELLKPGLFSIWERTVQLMDKNYVMNPIWYTGGKVAAYELKFQRAGTTLVFLFPKDDSIGLMIKKKYESLD